MKKFLCIILALGLAFAFVGCKKSSGDVGSDFTSGDTQYSSTVGISGLTASSNSSGSAAKNSSKKTSSKTPSATSSAAKTSSFNLNNSNTSTYIDANKDFSGKTTIVGRWRCISKTENGVTTDTSANEDYYIFSSDGTADTEYHGSHMFSYDSYKYEKGFVSLTYGETTIKLTCTLTETSLTLAVGNIKTVYERAEYAK